MEKKLAALRLGSRVRFRDRWEGRLAAFEVDEGWDVVNLAVRRGLLFTSSVKLPFSAAYEWSREQVSFDCSADEAFGRQIPPLAVPARLLSAGTKLTAAGATLAGALVSRPRRQTTHLLIRHGVMWRERKAAVDQVSFEDGRLRLAVQLDALPPYVSDEDLQLLVREVLARSPYLTGDDRRALSVEACDGAVRLSGNVRTTQARERAGRVAAAAVGAASLENAIVDDIGLEMVVAQALHRAGLSDRGSVYVRSWLGEVTLLGSAPSAWVREEMVRVACRLPAVRSVTDRLQVERAAQ